jgi:hypothetical protein
MALMMIIAGACLAIGGLLGFFSGFDHMTTERGAAATIAGVTALAGGLVSIGLGFVVARLTQILAAYEDDTGERIADALNANAAAIPSVAHASAAPTPVAVPSLADDIKPPAPTLPATPALAEADTLLRNPLNRPEVTAEPAAAPEVKPNGAKRLLARLGGGKAVVATGAAVAAAGAGAALAGLKAEEPAAPSADEKAADLEPVMAKIEEATTSDVSTVIAPDTLPSALDSNDSENLEAELALALKEDLMPAAAAEVEKTTEVADTQEDTAVEDPLEDVAAPPPPKTRGRRKFTEMLAATRETDSQPEEPEPAKIEAVEVPEMDTAQAEEPEDIASPVASTELPTEDETVQPDGPAVIGRYVRDGNTYTLYADGSVDALTDAGLQRYKSMEDLRNELMKE